MACPCEGAFPNRRGRHFVVVAFLNRDNRQYVRPAGLTLNDALAWISGSPWIHCALMFWEHVERDFVAFSANGTANTTTVERFRTFAYGWQFYIVEVARADEVAMYAFCLRQRNKPFNELGAIMCNIRPVNLHGDAWYCAELTAAALLRGNVLHGVAPHTTDPPSLKALLDLLRQHGASIRVTDESPLLTYVRHVANERELFDYT